jgi:hypothetical protein
MRRTLLTLLAASSLAVAAPVVANAQSWTSMSQRQYGLEQRMNTGIRNGLLTSTEAAQLRADFNALMRLEMSYRRSAPGLTTWELQDLDRRFDVLSNQLDREMADNDRYGRDRYDRDWADDDSDSIEVRRVNLDRRIEQGLRSGQLTRAEARDLRAEFNGVVRLENQYRATGGLSYSERNELDGRYDLLAEHIRMARTDSDRRYGQGYGNYDD